MRLELGCTGGCRFGSLAESDPRPLAVTLDAMLSHVESYATDQRAVRRTSGSSDSGRGGADAVRRLNDREG
ncbi:hypothetical protein [Kribbella sp. ALI-6-A]|uniref:hypothetical protein n=1 Tax=Kribbella sp. ALI-6-A TaxID=1933817 RepID=UPI00117A11B7|nr:hypothetical protein [Kribbella sp. ALI-6-A]